MFIYNIRVFNNNYDDDDYSEYGRSYQDLGYYSSLEKALQKAREHLNNENAFFDGKVRSTTLVASVDEIVTALKVVMGHAIKYVEGNNWDHEILLERIKVEE